MLRKSYASRYLVKAVLLGFAAAALPATCGAQPEPSQNGISVEQYHRLFPPLPQNVRAEIRDGKAVISWDKPEPPPPGRIGYDPVVVRYHVYLMGRDQSRRLIGRTTGMSFVDPNKLNPGTMRRYGVTAIQRSGQESAISSEAELHVPLK